MKKNCWYLLLVIFSLNNTIAQPVNYISSFNFPCDSLYKIIPGTGWTGATPSGVVGNSSLHGYDAKAIARWNVVPFQDVTDKLRIGVVAFHINGIDRVEFSADNGAWVSANKMTFNPTSGTWEYQVELDASDFTDGVTEIRAVVYPQTAGECRVLDDFSGTDLGEQSLHLYANSGLTLANTGVIKYVDATNGNDTTGNGSVSLPWKTIATAITAIGNAASLNVSGATIRLFPGSYEYPAVDFAYSEDRWLNIEGHPSYPKSAVVMTQMLGPGSLQKRVCFRHLRVALPETGVAFLMRSGPYGNMFWADNLEARGLGHLCAGGPGTCSTGSMTDVHIRFYTGIDVSDTRNSEFHADAILVRNVTARNLGGDFLNTNKLVVNCSVNHMRFDGGVHPDVIQVIQDTRNMIVYGLQAYDFSAQLAIGGGNAYAENIALVNVVLSQKWDDPQIFWMPGNSNGVYNHILLWHITTRQMGFYVNQGGGSNVSIRNCMFDEYVISNPNLFPLDNATFPGIIADHNHFTGVNTFGTNVTSGPIVYTDTINLNFTPVAGSPLIGNASGNLVPVDATNMIRSNPASIGGLESADWYNAFSFSYSADDTICAGQAAMREVNGVDTSIFNVYWNNSATKGDTSFVYTPGASTVLPVTIQTKNSFGCATIDHSFNIHVDQCLSQNEINENTVRAYPTITYGDVTLEGLNEVFGDNVILLQCYNLYGQLVFTKSIYQPGTVYNLATDSWLTTAGMYSMLLSSGDISVTKKILFVE